jgi:hypothetical protein
VVLARAYVCMCWWGCKSDKTLCTTWLFQQAGGGGGYGCIHMHSACNTLSLQLKC